MSKDDWPKRSRFQTWFLDKFPLYLLLLSVIGVAALAVWQSPVGNVFIYAGESWCTWTATAKAWLDENANSKWDANEPPLPGVQFSIGLDHPVSDFKGEGHGALVSVLACDPSFKISISAELPLGYYFTTSSTVTTTGGEGNHGPFLFGFAYLPGVPTITPRPIMPTPSK